jgi:exopolysaccharide biosynthesis predicted pyruvyltransferase EpsI
MNAPPQRTTSRELLAQLESQSVEVLSRHLRGSTEVALLDFPGHQNSGDSMIFFGQKAYLSRLGVRLAYICDAARYDPSVLRRRCPNGPILLQGGGNFGDRWVEIQEFRERVIADFPDRPIIQLPQSIDFQSDERLALAKERMGSHPELTLLIRDHAGAERTRLLFPSSNVEFCPDSAFGMGLLSRRREPVVDVIEIRRRDSEGVGHAELTMPSGVTVERHDWGLLGARAVAWRVVRAPGSAVRRFPAASRALYPLLPHMYEMQARLNVGNAVRLLSRGRVVVTDRLHATVLAALLGIPVVATDNAYGKVSALVRDYLGQFPEVHFVEDPSTAGRFVNDILQRVRPPATAGTGS